MMASVGSLSDGRSARLPPSAESRRYTVVDVFTDTPLEGNQLAVFHEGEDLEDDLMQRTARELNLSETVFMLSPEKGGDLRVRLFTPTAELPFAGHPVLGTAFVLADDKHLPELTLETGIGPVRIQLLYEDGRPVFGRMEQPVPTWEIYDREGPLLEALRVDRSLLPVEAYTNGPRHVYVELPSDRAVAAVEPDLTALGELGLAANCFARSGQRWKTRVFAPSYGVAEDPATGSAAGPLAVHLARHGRIAFGDEIEILQGAEIGRPSVLHACAYGREERVERVVVGGRAVLVASGQYRLR